MKNKEIKIRKAEEKDYEAVNALYREIYTLFNKGLPDFYKKMPKKTLPKGTFLNMIDDKKCFFVVSELENQVNGTLYAIIEEEEGDNWTYPYRRISVEEICVHPSFRGKGIGTLLMNEIEKWATKMKISELMVLIYSFNDSAINFYNKNGYKPYSIKLNKNIKP